MGSSAARFYKRGAFSATFALDTVSGGHQNKDRGPVGAPPLGGAGPAGRPRGSPVDNLWNIGYGRYLLEELENDSREPRAEETESEIAYEGEEPSEASGEDEGESTWQP